MLEKRLTDAHVFCGLGSGGPGEFLHERHGIAVPARLRNAGHSSAALRSPCDHRRADCAQLVSKSGQFSAEAHQFDRRRVVERLDAPWQFGRARDLTDEGAQ